jgi:hypothetical protein
MIIMFHPYFTAETQGTQRYLLAMNKTGRTQMGTSGSVKIATVGRADMQSCRATNCAKMLLSVMI